MRVSISGSHSVGKTSLITKCREILTASRPQLRVDYIGEVARQVLAMGLPLNEDATFESYFVYWRMQLEYDRLATAPLVLSDRSLVDSLAYLETARLPSIPESFVALLREIVQMEARCFDLFCYVPVEYGLEFDHVRPPDTGYMMAVDARLRQILERYELPVFEVSGPTEQRARQLLGRLGLWDGP